MDAGSTTGPLPGKNSCVERSFESVASWLAGIFNRLIWFRRLLLVRGKRMSHGEVPEEPPALIGLPFRLDMRYNALAVEFSVPASFSSGLSGTFYFYQANQIQATLKLPGIVP